MRFCSQNSKNSCGPFAIINACKVFGIRATIKDKPRFMKLCKTPRTRGTYVPNFDRALRKTLKKYAKVTKRRSRDHDDVVRYISQSPTVFLFGHHFKNGIATRAHWIVTIPESNGKIKIINSRKTVETITISKFMKLFGRKCEDVDPPVLKLPQIWTLKGK